MSIRIDLSSSSGPETTHIVWGPLALTMVLAAWFLRDFVDEFPPCIFREIVGLPCLTCGSTRAIMALSRLDFAASFLSNPLVPVAIAVLIILSLITALGWLLKKRIVLSLPRGQKTILRGFVILVIMVNWLYLIAADR